MPLDLDQRRGPREIRAAILVAALLLLAIAALTGIALERERRLLVQQARQDATSLAALFEENTARTFDSVDNALEGIAIYMSALRPPPDDAAARETMRARLKFLPTVRALFVIGPDGFIIHDTDFPKTPRISLADRPYFRRHIAEPGLTRALSEALQSRSGTGWFVASTRRITLPDGRLYGVAVAAVQLGTISNLYRKMDLRPGQQVSLLLASGTMLARYPSDDRLVGRSFAPFPVFRDLIPKQRSGTFESDGPPWDYARIVSYRALDTQPLVVVVTTPLDSVLAPWKRTVAGSVAALALLALLTGAVLLFFLQRQRERTRAMQLQAAQVAAVATAQANAKFRSFFEQGSQFACVIGTSGGVLEVNHTGREAAAGAAPGADPKFWDRSWWSSVASQPAMLRTGFERACAGETFRTEASFEGPGGEARLMELVLSPVRGDDGSVLAVAAVGTDVTARKRQEEQLRALAGNLSDVDRRRSEFLATLSHELRNALTPAQNCSQILNIVDPASPPAVRARQILSQQLAQARRLIDDLLDVSRIDSGKIQLSLQALDLRGALTQAAAAAHTSMERAGHRFEVSLPGEELPVVADAARLQQVFSNLLGNAAKYTPQGGHVRLRARREGDEALVDVQDDGLGIPPESQGKVFEMFEQVTGHSDHREGGLGIGLGLVSKLVALHGGRVALASEGVGQGSTFTVRLPLAGSAGSPRPAAMQ